VRVLPEGHGEAVDDRVVAVPQNRVRNARPVTLRAGPLVKFRVRAVTAGAKPIPDARVTLVDGQPQYDKSFSWGYDDAGWSNMVRARTAADGWADFPALSFSAATVVVQAPGYGRQRLGWRAREKDLALELAKEAVLSGEVLDAKGKPVKVCYVHLESNG